MTLSLEAFARNFHPYPVPETVRLLYLFQEEAPERYSDSFELNVASAYVLKAHIRPESGADFFCLGHDGNDSWYALWRFKEMPLDEAPVVYLNSEGEGSTVWARTLREFLTLLAYDDEPIFGVYRRHQIQHTARNRAFRRWLATTYGLEVASNPNVVVRQARASHPALPLWYASAK